jgi:glucosamine-6-phosphate deaminase
VKKAFFDKVTPVVPASIIQMHNDAIIVGDEAAFSKIEI